jgi:hypothetical protein
MSSEIEAAGAALTAGLAAAAIDEHQKGHGHVPHGPCANCGDELTGEFCSACGQPAHVHRSLGHMAEEFLHGILHFDSRAWRTLPLLVFRPGTLTHAYIHGKRARFISPLAIFLLAVFTMFFVFSLTGGSQVGVSDASKSKAEIQQGADENTERIAETEKALAEARSRANPDAAVRAEIIGLETRLNALRGALAVQRATLEHTKEPGAAAPGVNVKVTDNAIGGVDETRNYNLHDAGVYEQIADAARAGKINVRTGWPALDKKILHKLENPELAIYKIQNGAYKLAFLLAPISLPFVWLLFFWKKGMTLFDHTVFILYSLSFVSLLFIVISLASMLPAGFDAVILVAMAAIPVHFYFHIKGSYALGWFSALWRLPFLLVFASVSLLLFLAAIVGLGFVG